MARRVAKRSPSPSVDRKMAEALAHDNTVTMESTRLLGADDSGRAIA